MGPFSVPHHGGLPDQCRHHRAFQPSSFLAQQSPYSGTPITLTEPRVMLQVADKSITFLVLISHSGPMVPSLISVLGRGGDRSPLFHSLPLSFMLVVQFFSHSFLVTPRCLVPLLGHEILRCFGATLSLSLTISLDFHTLLPRLPHRSLYQMVLSLPYHIQLIPKYGISPTQ